MVSKKPSSPKKKSPSSDSPKLKSAPARATSPAKAEKTEEDSAEDGKVGATRPDEMPAEVLEFIQAIDEYKRINRRPFPSWSEVLEVLKALGYNRVA